MVCEARGGLLVMEGITQQSLALRLFRECKQMGARGTSSGKGIEHMDDSNQINK
jgi:hypothetical protein